VRPGLHSCDRTNEWCSRHLCQHWCARFFSDVPAYLQYGLYCFRCNLLPQRCGEPHDVQCFYLQRIGHPNEWSGWDLHCYAAWFGGKHLPTYLRRRLHTIRYFDLHFGCSYSCYL
jgi:hypothetical protein